MRQVTGIQSNAEFPESSSSAGSSTTSEASESTASTIFNGNRTFSDHQNSPNSASSAENESAAVSSLLVEEELDWYDVSTFNIVISRAPSLKRCFNLPFFPVQKCLERLSRWQKQFRNTTLDSITQTIVSLVSWLEYFFEDKMFLQVRNCENKKRPYRCAQFDARQPIEWQIVGSKT